MPDSPVGRAFIGIAEKIASILGSQQAATPLATEKETRDTNEGRRG